MSSLRHQADARWDDVTLANWMTPPYHTLAFQRVADLIPSVTVAAADAATRWPWFETGGRLEIDVETVLDATDTDVFLVLRTGRVEHEEYRRGMTSATPHLCMSVSKSVAGTLAGVLVEHGLLDPTTPVTELVPRFAGTGMEGATVRHVLDMRTGTREDIVTVEQQRRYYATALWAPAEEAPARDPDTRTHFWRFTRDREHGGAFQYRSTLTCVLALLMERATGRRYPDLVSEYLWRPMGAEQSAQVTVDVAGYALADIGFSCTARDLARFGELLRCSGHPGPDARSVVPAAWIADVLTPDPGQQRAFKEAGSVYLPHRAGYYRNQWWVAEPREDDRGGAWFALGIYGQLLYVDEVAELVVVKFSSWPQPWVPEAAEQTYRMCNALAGGRLDW